MKEINHKKITEMQSTHYTRIFTTYADGGETGTEAFYKTPDVNRALKAFKNQFPEEKKNLINAFTFDLKTCANELIGAFKRGREEGRLYEC